MFEQDRYAEQERPKGMFRGDSGLGAGVRRYQVSGAGDSAEIAADRAADQAVGGGLFRSAEGGGGGFQADLADSDLDGGGSPLPAGLMGSMEQSLGGSFSGVRVHTDAGADRASRQIDARAFTRGQDIYFSSGSYDPESREGQHLIAHELAHVAAGDTGIHRVQDGTAPQGQAAAPQQEKDPIDKEREKLTNAVSAAGAYQKSVEASVIACDSEEKVSDMILTGALGKTQLAAKKDLLAGIETKVDEQVSAVNQALQSYTGEWTKQNGSGDVAQDRSYQDATAVKDALNQFKTDHVSKAKTAVEKFAGQYDATQGVAAGQSPFSESVNAMLDDAACGQFFKAVEDVRKGAAGIKPEERAAKVENLEGTARAARKTSTDPNHAQELQETRHEANSRRSGNAGLALAFTGLGSDALGGAADLLTEKHGDPEGNQEMEKKYEDTRMAAGVIGAASAGADAVNTTVGAVSEGKMLSASEKEQKRKIAALSQANPNSGIGQAGTADHAGRVAVASQAFGAMSSALGAGSSIAGGFKSNNKTAGDWNNGLALASSSLGVIGDTMGMAADSDKARKARQRDMMAKASMKTLGGKLEDTIPGGNTLNERQSIIKGICTQLKNKAFNSKGFSLLGQINKAMDEGPSNPEKWEDSLKSRQKPLLTSLRALEASRAASKGEASDARKSALTGALGLSGSITGLIGNALKTAGLGTAGSIMGLVGSGIGFLSKMLGGGKPKGKADAVAEKKAERDAKLDACGAAVQQMAALPALKLDLLRNARTNQEAQPAVVTQAAEQYAAVYHTINSANVNMVDFLYAVEKGGFGGTGANNQANTMDASIAAMYKELTFS